MNTVSASRVTHIIRRLMLSLLCFGFMTHAQAACYFRVNGWNATDEGVLLARYARGVSGPALVASTNYAARNPVDVRAAFERVKLAFDMNGDGVVNDVDATIVLRHVSGVRGNVLTQGVSLAGGSRGTTDAVQAFIDSGCVAPISTRAPIYLSNPDTNTRANFLTQTNGLGSQSYVYLSPLFVSLESFNLYAVDTPGVFTYRSLDTPTTATNFELLLNAQGAERYRFGGVLTTGSYFYRDENSDPTFSYRLLALPTTTSAFLTQANSQGIDGYFFFLPYSVGGSTYAIYAKESTSAVYSYTLQPSTDTNATADDFVTQADAQGANGYRFRTSYAFTEGARNIYVKDTAQSATFTWKHNAEASNSAALVAQANTEGAAGYVYLGARVFFPTGLANPSQTRVVYFKPSNCAGSVMCSPPGPF